ncbi:ABC transporter substrate-binding protein [Mariniradius sediminis]|uniref:ABC transporter substrate-binding protein n=1 Tax=Mariniradius sediminis TaxID=2909237 RepID=A0ABS9BT13_9BACT|nr:ABC transporter substrate-binding protein [Mariniradius sediminis]MCF1751213.1 ABC transporter substrate-binding protein [Mariniradius sediminis]
MKAEIPTANLLIRSAILFWGLGVLCGCSQRREPAQPDWQEIQPVYATGFTFWKGEGFLVLEVKNAYAGQKNSIRYLIHTSADSDFPEESFEAVVVLPAERVVLTATTQIPHLDYLGKTDALIGFPNLDLISSPAARERIAAGEIEDLGAGPQSNIERIIDLNPDWVQISTLGNELSNLDLLRKAGVPAILNGDYLEQHPLGRAEWIKVTGALLGKSAEADSIFRVLEKEYLGAIALVKQQNLMRPRVLAGIMYQDVWYLPGGDSWAAKLLESAGADYLFSNIEGTGSAELSYEYVLDRAMDADVWIGVADFPSLEEMGAADRRYQDFKAFQTGEVYTYALKKGPTGGLEYFELGYLRPDWILKDLIKVLHPELLPDYQPYFYQKIDAK